MLHQTMHHTSWSFEQVAVGAMMGEVYAGRGMQDPEELYLELAQKVREGLAHVDPYFEKLAKGMEDWIACWRQLNPDVRRAFLPSPFLIFSSDIYFSPPTWHRSSRLWW